MTFWDFCAPFYDFAEQRNAKAYSAAVKTVRDMIPDGASVLEVVAGNVFHLIYEPEKAAAELRRAASCMVILPMSLTKGLKGIANLMVNIYRLFGFAPKRELVLSEYASFLCGIGFENCEIIPLEGIIPIAVAVWRKKFDKYRKCMYIVCRGKNMPLLQVRDFPADIYEEIKFEAKR